jgi:hypothetical protein
MTNTSDRKYIITAKRLSSTHKNWNIRHSGSPYQAGIQSGHGEAFSH